VGLRLSNQAAEIDFTRLDWVIWLAVIGLALVYGSANLLLAMAWRNLLDHFGIRASLHWTVRAYGISQIAKYVPGNLFHLAGRQALGLAAGLPGWPLAKSSAWELGLIAFTGALFGVLALPLLLAEFPTVAGLTLFVATIGGATALLWRFCSRPVAYAFDWYAVFLTISGLLFVILVELVSRGGQQQEIVPLLVIGAYVLAWLAGLVTPGAPAGMGVRELMLLILLNGMVGETDLLLAVLLGRLVTVIGDMVFLGIALALGQEAA